MERTPDPSTRKSSGERKVSSVSLTTHSIADVFAEILRPFSAKEIARRLRVPSVRTVESWKERRTSPQAKHVVAMLADDELCALLLDGIGQRDAAHAAKVQSARKKLAALEGR